MDSEEYQSETYRLVANMHDRICRLEKRKLFEMEDRRSFVGAVLIGLAIFVVLMTLLIWASTATSRHERHDNARKAQCISAGGLWWPSEGTCLLNRK